MRKICPNKTLQYCLNCLLYYLPKAIKRIGKYSADNAEIVINPKDGEIIIRIKKEI